MSTTINKLNSVTLTIKDPNYKGLITFYIEYNGQKMEYQAEEGMTWAEFLDSKYNTDGRFISFIGQLVQHRWSSPSAKGGYVGHDKNTILELTETI